jgi:hypothetical protein
MRVGVARGAVRGRQRIAVLTLTLALGLGRHGTKAERGVVYLTVWLSALFFLLRSFSLKKNALALASSIIIIKEGTEWVRGGWRRGKQFV